MATPPPATQIPSFYRIFFTILDPILCTSGIITSWLLPRFYLLSFFPNPSITPETRLSLDIIAGFFAATLVLQVWLLRARKNDVTVWKAVEAAILVQDIAALGAFARIAGEQGRLEPGMWTLYEWGNVVILTGVAAIRAAFLAGIGLKSGKGKAQ